MKKYTRSMMRALLGVVLLIAFLLAMLAPPPARADTFGTTNKLVVATITSMPTNTLGLATGRGIGTPNDARLGFYFSGTATTNGTLTVNLVRSVAASPAAVTDWETTSAIQLSIPIATTNTVFNWYTNLDVGYIGAAPWIGISSIQLAGPAADCVVSNVTFGVVKKTIPMRLK